MKKLIIAVAVSALPALLLCGCGNKDGYNSKKHVEAAIQYMNSKYGYEFALAGDNTQLGSGDVFGRHSEYVNILLSCNELPGKNIEVFSNDGQKYFDDFICRKYEDRIAEDIKEIVDEVYDGDPPTVRVFGKNFGYISQMTLSADTDYDTMMKSGSVGWVEICVDDRDDEVNKYRRLAGILMEKEINCEPSVYHFTDYCYKDVSDAHPAEGIELIKKCGQVRLYGFEPLLDEEFEGKLMIRGDAGLQTEVPLEPAPDETEDTYAKYFKSREENDSEASESRRAFLEDTSFESVAEWHGFNHYDDNGSLIDSYDDTHQAETTEITLRDFDEYSEPDLNEGTHKPVDSIDMGDVSMPDIPKMTTYKGN